LFYAWKKIKKTKNRSSVTQKPKKKNQIQQKKDIKKKASD